MTQTISKKQEHNLIPYKLNNGEVIEVKQYQNDMWLTTEQIARLFGCSQRNVQMHLKNIYDIGELDKFSTTKFFFVNDNHAGFSPLKSSLKKLYYNRRAIFHVGYRVNSKMGMMFRNWASDVLEEKVTGNNANKKPQKFISTEKKERAKLINTLLRKKGIKQDYIAKATGYARTTVCDVINGKYINPIILNWIEINLFSKKRKQNDFNEKSKEIFENALQGDHAAYNKVKKILRAVAAVHDFT